MWFHWDRISREITVGTRIRGIIHEGKRPHTIHLSPEEVMELFQKFDTPDRVYAYMHTLVLAKKRK